MSADDSRGATVNVLYVNRRNAKTVKVALESLGLLDKQFRMTQPTKDSLQDDACIAIPVTDECLETEGSWTRMVVSIGRQHCPYSSSFLGNYKNKQQFGASSSEQLTHVQQALMTALIQCSQQEVSEQLKKDIVQRIKHLNVSVCPKKLEVIGDDRTVVIPRKAFRQEDLDEQFASLLALVSNDFDWSNFWNHFASSMGSPRVVRRGDIDPDSSIRESGHRLLWPHSGQPDETGALRCSDEL